MTKRVRYALTAVQAVGICLLGSPMALSEPLPDPQSAQTPSTAESPTEPRSKIITVRPPDEVMSRQGLPYFVGISEKTAGAQGLSMNLVVIPPGGAARPHLHRGYESAIYLLKGRVETRFGPGLQQKVVNREGDFIFIPPNLPHQPHNLSDTEPALAIVARNDPNEQENVVPYDPEMDN